MTRDIVVVAPEGWPESGTFHGWDPWRGQIRRLKEAFAEETYEIDALESRGPVVIVSGRWRGRAAGSGLQFELKSWVIFVVREGKVARLEYFLDEPGARARLDELAAV